MTILQCSVKARLAGLSAALTNTTANSEGDQPDEGINAMGERL